ncbi:acyltransferase [Pseudalgibacter alginicilyticus]|uniref:Acyltransferase n=1 Tax=Pseudalgibacter alginicilyticus TaxID=1736674 RepID=A0A0P0DBF8_9FLAO|nr:MBOAT family O-acyltransferase [Pseudalgibacter alginicilyticus]ALJ05263.1 acyltransferase [Pseudalgibacter alginicilyticus]
MLFNSLEFAVFLPIVFLLYWFVPFKKIKHQNILILASCYFFYGWWDWKFLFLIIFSSLLDFYLAKRISKTDKNQHRKWFLRLSIIANISLLGIFKYYDFFIESFSETFKFFGQTIDPQRLHLILPIGISFYTFQTLSYTIDVYNKKLKATNDVIAFCCFVSFFPQLVAGPIERASNLLPQFLKKRKFNYNIAVNGSRQILWGFFKKVVIADNCARYVSLIFNDAHEFSGSTLMLGAVLFAFQIYGDFSGYSDIAIGTAKLFGFEFKQNFAFPYFSQNIAEFWRRWHISLTTWFRDYIYIPLGGSRVSKPKAFRNIFIVFMISGLWHGANWTFIIWAILHFLYYIPTLFFNKRKKQLNKTSKKPIISSIKVGFNILTTFMLVTFAWIFFRADSIKAAFAYINGIFSNSIISLPEFLSEEKLWIILFFIGFQTVIEWKGRFNNHALEHFEIQFPKYIRYGFYYALVMAIFLFGGKQEVFIYFQF